MTIKPGDIFHNVKIEATDPQKGVGLFSVNGIRCHIFNHDIPNVTVKKGLSISKVVCCGTEQEQIGFRCFTVQYNHRLIKTLYLINSQFIHFKKSQDHVWRQRWREIIHSSGSVSCHACTPPPWPTINGRKWIMLRTKTWEMPVLIPEVRASVTEEPIFYPTSLALEQDAQLFPSPAVYTPSAKAFKFPLNYTGTLSCPGTQFPDTQINIKLHSFIEPAKWHYGVRKHFFSNGPGAFPQERLNWIDRFANTENPIPHCPDAPSVAAKECDAIFQDCRANGHGTSCAPCGTEQFTGINNKITESLQCYLSAIVTLFESQTTNAVIIRPLGDNLYGVRLLIRQAQNGYYHFAVFYGTLMAEEDRPKVLHLTPVTQYLPNKKRPFSRALHELIGELHHVQPE